MISSYTLYLVSDLTRVPKLVINPLAAILLVAHLGTMHLKRMFESFNIFVYCIPLEIRKSVWEVIALYNV